jgi:hypothetical protein
MVCVPRIRLSRKRIRFSCLTVFCYCRFDPRPQHQHSITPANQGSPIARPATRNTRQSSYNAAAHHRRPSGSAVPRPPTKPRRYPAKSNTEPRSRPPSVEPDRGRATGSVDTKAAGISTYPRASVAPTRRIASSRACSNDRSLPSASARSNASSPSMVRALERRRSCQGR